MSGIDLTRRAACALIAGVTENQETLAEQIGAGIFDGLAPADRARAQRLTLSVLRNLDRIDAMLKPHLRKQPPADLRAVLRLATYELCAEEAAAHGVVHAAVTMVREGGKKTEGFTGLVNAVLRKISAETERWARLPAPALPNWLRGRLMSAYGKVPVMKMEAAHLAGAPIDLTLKTQDPSEIAAYGEKLGAVVLPTGSVRLPAGVQLTELPGFAEGDWWVQDTAASLAAKVLGDCAGQQVLDLCAAPGGKTLQLAAKGAEVTALDISESRLARLHENLDRMGLSAEVLAVDALEWQPDAAFDAILFDAPCSATGTIRRHPDLPYVKDSASIKELAALQSALLERAITWLKPGGTLVYCTCSLLPEEGEKQIEAALATNPALSLEAIEIDGIAPEWSPAVGQLRLRPDYWAEMGGMDGFFIAKLRLAA